jgi:hypothetical protein
MVAAAKFDIKELERRMRTGLDALKRELQACRRSAVADPVMATSWQRMQTRSAVSTPERG